MEKTPSGENPSPMIQSHVNAIEWRGAICEFILMVYEG